MITVHTYEVYSNISYYCAPEVRDNYSVMHMYISELHLTCGCRVVLASAFTSCPGEISAVRFKFVVFLTTLPAVLPPVLPSRQRSLKLSMGVVTVVVNVHVFREVDQQHFYTFCCLLCFFCLFLNHIRTASMKGLRR